MTFLINARPNWIVPVFRQTGNIIEYKRFPADYMWRSFLDLSGVAVDLTPINEAIAELQLVDAAMLASIEAVAALANTANETAETALSTANDALAAVGTAADRDAAWMVDESAIIGETGTNSISTSYIYGVAWFTANAGSAFRWRDTLDMSLGGTFKFWFHRFPTGGISNLSVDGNNLGTINFYNASNSFNNFGTLTLDADVVGTSRHTIDITNTLAGSGSGRGQGITKLMYIGNGA